MDIFLLKYKQMSTETKQQGTVEVKLEDIVIDAKYNSALFIKPACLGLDDQCRDLINRGLETVEIRKLVHLILLESAQKCRDLFKDRNRRASEFKLSVIDQCSYCEEKTKPNELLTYFTVAHADDLIIKEITKRVDEKTRNSCLFKYVPMWNLQTKIRDVRSHEPLVVNQGCALLCLTRCVECMKNV